MQVSYGRPCFRHADLRRNAQPIDANTFFPSPDFFDDCVRVSGPDEGLGVVVGFDEVSVDGGLEISDALEHASLEPVLGQFGEEPFDSIEP